MTTDVQWNDTKCSVCGALAHCQTGHVITNEPVSGMEYLCKSCRDSIPLPSRTFVMVVRCAEPNCPHRAAGRVEATLTLHEEGSPAETHYVCHEHLWCWRQRLGAEWEMLGWSISVNSMEHNEQPLRILRDDMQGATWIDETNQTGG